MVDKMKNLRFKVFFLFVVSFCNFSSFAQKVNLNKEKFKVKYKESPTKNIGYPCTTYFTEAKVGNTSNFGYSERNVSGMVQVFGMKYSEENPDLFIKVDIGDVMVKDFNPSSPQYVKDAYGKTKVVYSFSIDYSLPISYVVLNNKKDVILEAQYSKFNENSKYSKSDIEYRPSFADAQNQVVASHIDMFVKKLNGLLSANYGFPEHNIELTSWVLDSKKHPENDAFYGHFETISKALANITNASKSDLIDKLDDSLKYLESIEKKYSTDSKDDAKMRYSAFLLLSQVYYFLDDPISSNNFSNKLVKNGLYPEDAKQMTEMSDELLKKFNETKIPIRLAE